MCIYKCIYVRVYKKNRVEGVIQRVPTRLRGATRKGMYIWYKRCETKQDRDTELYRWDGERGKKGYEGWEKIKRADKPRGGLYSCSFHSFFFIVGAAALIHTNLSLRLYIIHVSTLVYTQSECARKHNTKLKERKIIWRNDDDSLHTWYVIFTIYLITTYMLYLRAFV